MPLIADAALDAALEHIRTNATTLHISSSPTPTFGSLGSLGTKTVTGTLTAPADRSGGGREITIPALTGGTVSGSGTVTTWALVSGSALLAWGDVTDQVVTSGNTFSTTAAIAIGIPDAV